MFIFSSCQKDIDLGEELETQQNEVSRDLQRSCGMQEHHSKMMTDDSYRKNHERKLSKMQAMSSGRSAICSDPTVLPIAVHYQGVSNPDAACLIELAKSQIDILNDDYTSQNDDINNWTDNAASSFPNINNGETCVKFCIATQNHPTGYNLSNGDLAVTINQTTGDNVSAWSGYINIFVRPDLGYLGYSPLGGTGDGDGVVVDANAFGSGAGCGTVSPDGPYDLGRTLTHELGHYLLLDHVWGGNGGCNDDDGVNDTPVSTEPYYGCPSIGASSCSSTDLHMNYMDYTNDACMYMFTAGQSTRMENYFISNLQNVIANAANVCDESGEPNEPSCDDGIQNGDETGVDCGGPDCVPCMADPTCDDGIQNGQETGVDCGGPDCRPCEVDPTCDDGIQNGQETGVDCGGPECVPCALTPTCDDGIQNGQETGVDCGGPECVPCDTNPNGCDATPIYFELVLDDFGSETTWYLVDDYGQIITGGGPFEDGTDGQTIKEEFCLEDGCYYVAVLDEYRDGICCYYGEGSFSLYDEYGDEIASSTGEFGYWDYLDFCIESGEIGSWGFRTDPRSNARANTNKRQ